VKERRPQHEVGRRRRNTDNSIFDENVCVPTRLNPTRIPTVIHILQDSTVRSPSAVVILWKKTWVLVMSSYMVTVQPGQSINKLQQCLVQGFKLYYRTNTVQCYS
jgi:hypothetical protein